MLCWRRWNRFVPRIPLPDFFIGYNTADERWATWIAYVLEEEGLTTVVQAWDFPPGTNFVLHMQKAATGCDRTIAVLSPAYLSSVFAQSEWAAAFAGDPVGDRRSLVPVMVERCSPPGLLKSIVYIDIVGADEERARGLVLDGLQSGRRKPSIRPSFPGRARPTHPPFPAGGGQTAASRSAYVPTIRKSATDVDKRRFMKAAFETIFVGFEKSLAELSVAEEAVDCELERRSTAEFTAEIFLHGKSACRCRIWQGALPSSDGISYAEGRTSGNATNEMLAIAEGGELALSALMGGFHHQWEEGVDQKRLSGDQAFRYLWRRFVAPLER
jgi:TIR domain